MSGPMLRTAVRYYRFSGRLAARAVRQARRAPTLAAAALVIAQHQATQANEVSAATTAMLAEQGLERAPLAPLVPLAFTTGAAELGAMLSQADVDWRFDRLVSSLVQDAGRAAQLVDVTARPEVQHVRHLNLPSCSRCAVLAGRVYRYSTGFKRHPGCDCVMIPTTIAAPDLTYDPQELVRTGQVTGLSKADRQAIEDGADLGQVTNIRRRSAGLMESGEALTRGDRPTPAGIYRAATSREDALERLAAAGYIRP